MKQHRDSWPAGAAILLATGLGAWSPGVASATVVVFDNSALTFKWSPTIPGGGEGAALDPTMPPELQAQWHGPHTFGWGSDFHWSSSAVVPEIIDGASTALGTQTFHYVTDSGGWTFTATKTFLPGDTVGPGENWQTVTTMGATSDSIPGYYDWFLGTSAYTGIRFDFEGGTHFGWIRLAINNRVYQPIAWAYETEADTPVTIVPAPWAPGFLVAGASVFLARPRRR